MSHGTKKHNGIIKVDSKENEGTEFRILLPLFIERKIKSPDKSKKILIADDDSQLLESLCDLFESCGYKTVKANDGLEVIEYINSNEPIDLLIIDKVMPNKDGIECINQIRTSNNSIPIIFVSGANIDDEEENLKIDVSKLNAIVKKPYDFDHLLNLVERLIL